eukprot:6205494-Pleurochrysis_carterae.AAC.2
MFLQPTTSNAIDLLIQHHLSNRQSVPWLNGAICRSVRGNAKLRLTALCTVRTSLVDAQWLTFGAQATYLLALKGQAQELGRKTQKSAALKIIPKVFG